MIRWKSLKKSLSSLVMATSLLFPQTSQREEPLPAARDYSTKTFEYTFQEKVYKISICGRDDYTQISSVSDALDLLKKDNSPSIILAGNFSDKERKVIQKVFESIHQVNPALISHLEPVIIRGDESYQSFAASNSMMSVK